MLPEENRSMPVLSSSSANCSKMLSLSSIHDSPERTFEPPLKKFGDLSSRFKGKVFQILPSRESSNIQKGILKSENASQFSSPVENTVQQNNATVNVGARANVLNNSLYNQSEEVTNTHINHSSGSNEVVMCPALSVATVCKLSTSFDSGTSQDQSKVKFSIIPAVSLKNSHNSTMWCLSNQSTSAVSSTQTSRSVSSTPVLDIKRPIVLLQDQNRTKSMKIQVKQPVSDITSEVMKRNIPVKTPIINTQPKSTTKHDPNLRCLKDVKSVNNVRYFKDPSMLRHYLMPCLEKLIVQNPESVPFRQPVDAEKLGIPDYYSIVTNPMDLSTIKTKLDTGQYQDGWEYVDDVWLMFDNAWLYNKKRSYVYMCCTKLSEIFKENIDTSMRSLGYCCGQNYVFEPQMLSCQFKDNCTIAKYAMYWSYQDKYNFCKKCVSSVKENFTVCDYTGSPFVIYINQLTEKKNGDRKEEFVKCIYCSIKVHKICGMQVDEIWKEGYICEKCKIGVSRARVLPQQFSYKSLQETKLGSHLENRVNTFLINGGCNARVVIRVVYQGRKEFAVTEGLKTRYVDTGIWPEKFPYTSKTILAFQERTAVCFFALFVQEYGSDCPQPNSRRVYISYLDSVHFFTPKHLRTSVYHEILLGYLHYVRCLGYKTAHLWSCPPPNENDEYVFRCHPKEQKVPSMKRLLEWYQKMLDKAISEGIVSKYKDIFEQAIEDNVKNAFELPYFDGDFLPTNLEKQITFLIKNAEEECSNGSQKNTYQENEKKMEGGFSKEKCTKCKKGKKYFKKAKTSSCQYTEDALTDKMYSLMKEHRKNFLVIHLSTPKNVLDWPINDPDPLISSTIMDARESFLSLEKEQNWEFSSLRRAKYSTIALVYNLHKDNMGSYSCNLCKNGFLKGFHCPACDDFDLCCDCFVTMGHHHKMEEINQDYQVYAKHQPQQRGTKGHPFSAFLNVLHHVSQCLGTDCVAQNCVKFKIMQEHVKECKVQFLQCRNCVYYAHLSYRHFPTCQTINCQILMCRKLKAIRSKLQIYRKSNGDEKCSTVLKMCIETSESNVPTKISELTNVFLSSIRLRTSRNVPVSGSQKLSPNNNSLYTHVRNENSSAVNSGAHKYLGSVEDIHSNKSFLSEPLQSNGFKIKNDCTIIDAKSEETKSHAQNFSTSDSVSKCVSGSLNINSKEDLLSNILNKKISSDGMIKMCNHNELKKCINYPNSTFKSDLQSAVTMSPVVMKNKAFSSVCTHQKEALTSNNMNLNNHSLHSSEDIQVSMQNMNNIQKYESPKISPELEIKSGIHSTGCSLNLTQLHSKLPATSEDALYVYNKSKFESSDIQTPAVETQTNLYHQTNNKVPNVYPYSDYSVDNHLAKLPGFQQHNQQPVPSHAWRPNKNTLHSDIEKSQNSAPANFQYENNKSVQFLRHPTAPVYCTPAQSVSSQNAGTLNSFSENPTIHNKLSDVCVPSKLPLNASAVEENKKITAIGSNYNDFLSGTKVPSTVIMHYPYNTVSYSSVNFQNLEPSVTASEADQSKMQGVKSDNFPANYFQFSNSNTLQVSSDRLKDYQMSFTQTSDTNAVNTKSCTDIKNYCNISSNQKLSHSFETSMDYKNDTSTYKESSTTVQYNMLNSQEPFSKENVQHQSNIYQSELPVKWSSSVNEQLLSASPKSFLQQQESILPDVNNQPFQVNFVTKQGTPEQLQCRKPIIYSLKNEKSFGLQSNHDNQNTLPAQQQDFNSPSTQVSQLNPSFQQWNSIYQIPSMLQNVSSHFLQSTSQHNTVAFTDTTFKFAS